MEIRPKKDIEELLAEGIETVESIKWKEQGESEILVSFKTDKAPLRDLLEIYGRLSKMGFAECGIEDRGSSGPVIRFVPVK